MGQREYCFDFFRAIVSNRSSKPVSTLRTSERLGGVRDSQDDPTEARNRDILEQELFGDPIRNFGAGPWIGGIIREVPHETPAGWPSRVLCGQLTPGQSALLMYEV